MIFDRFVFILSFFVGTDEGWGGGGGEGRLEHP